ncbi:hypothetical protein [Novosphingobium album (ex Liu et al. 2023)]|uniref:Uncharacterized protein n=1 Tax=Novosphingobium album (ex Liu et al. 2023) TaxID=3031130 RepID=A0ABT5WXW3_9SPHN|nr:hypothetical protein [Novosphingobium album (ex Liu et al. 2023)]MDE8654765.1 hypothetical protein [Novosphingobium album (ex Liu et al. 2023)]
MATRRLALVPDPPASDPAPAAIVGPRGPSWSLGAFADDEAAEAVAILLPTGLLDGHSYLNTTTGKTRVRVDGAWQDLDKDAQDAATVAGTLLTQTQAARDAAVEAAGAAASDAAAQVSAELEAAVSEDADRAEAAAVAAADSEAAAAGRRITSGEQIANAFWHEQANGGATLSSHLFTISAANTGASSFQSGYSAPSAELLAAAIGKTVRMTGVWQVSENFLTEKPLSPSSYLGRVVRGGVSTKLDSTNATHISTVQSGTLLTRIVEVDIGATDTAWGPGIQLLSSDLANNDHTFQLVSTAWEIASDPSSASTAMDDLVQARIETRGKSAEAFTLIDQGNLLGTDDVVRDLTAGAHGATVSGDTLTVPAGQTGYQGFIRYRYNFAGAENSGARIRVQMRLLRSASFTRSLTAHMQVKLLASQAVSTRDVIPAATVQDGSYITYTFDYDVQGDEDELRPYVIINNTAAPASDETLTCAAWRIGTITSPDADRQAVQDNLDKLIARLHAEIMTATVLPTAFPTEFVTVKPSGGDYTHPKLALDAIADATPTKRYAVLVYPGDYTGYAEWHTKDHVDIIGIGNREDIVISYANDNSASAATITNTSLLWLDTTTRLINLTLEITNGRYTIHLETNGNKSNSEQWIINCHVRHHGNDDAINNAWNSQRAVGSGTSPGQRIYARGSYFRGHKGSFNIHGPNNIELYDEPWFADIEGNTFVSDDPTVADCFFRNISIGAGDYIRFVGNTLALMWYGAEGEWDSFSVDPEARRDQLRVFGHSNSAFGFKNLIPIGAGGEGYTGDFTGAGGVVTVL